MGDVPMKCMGVRLWKNISGGWWEFSSHTIFEVGDGSKIRFWHDVWCRDQTLKAPFPDSFNLAIVRMLLWQIIWSFLMILINRMLTFLKRLMIRRWISLPRF